VRAIPVADEPEPFWDGGDELPRIAAWRAEVAFSPAWGDVQAVDELNGSSGAWVANEVLHPLRATRDDAWISDCLDTYRCSTGVRRAIDAVYRKVECAPPLPHVSLPDHPSESEIVREALAAHRERLVNELDRAQPACVVTLGNAALRVFRALPGIDVVAGDPGPKLRPDPYGLKAKITIAGRSVEWLPLAHPAAPKAYQAAHARWREQLR
jgi:hypothetical protein